MVSRQKFQKIMKKYSLGLWAVPKGLMRTNANQNQYKIPAKLIDFLLYFLSGD